MVPGELANLLYPGYGCHKRSRVKVHLCPLHLACIFTGRENVEDSKCWNDNFFIIRIIPSAVGNRARLIYFILNEI
jgi:hypothetical protein